MQTLVYFNKALNRIREKLTIMQMLYVTADGNKFLLNIIVNRKTIPNEKFAEDLIVKA